MPQPKDSAFWRFSLCFYAGPGIPDVCLQLQDECAADVNVVLYLLFLARAGRLLDGDDIDRIEALVTEWRDNVVRPVRQARRFLKTLPHGFDASSTSALRTDIKRIELETERLQQLSLECNLPPDRIGSAHADTHLCASRNLTAYARRLHDFPPAAVAALLRRLDDT